MENTPIENLNKCSDVYSENAIKEVVATTRGWLLVLGIINIVIAILYTLISFGTGLVISVPMFLVGLFLFKASKNAKKYIVSNEVSEIIKYHENLKKYFLTMGAITIFFTFFFLILIAIIVFIGFNASNIVMPIETGTIF